jgi:hypothetical protein
MTVAWIVLLAETTLAQPTTFVQDFRGGHPLSPGLEPFGQDVRTLVAATPDGLSVKFPRARSGTGPVGLSPKFAVHGNFEISVDYRVLTCETPPFGRGAGVGIRIEAGEKQRATASLCRLLEPSGKAVFRVDVNTATVPADASGTSSSFRAAHRMGRLRLARRATTLVFSAADGAIADYQELFRSDFSGADLGLTRIFATSHSAPAVLEVLITNTSIRADGLPNLSDADTRLESERTWSTTTFLVFGLSVLLVSLFTVLYRRRRTA